MRTTGLMSMKTSRGHSLTGPLFGGMRSSLSSEARATPARTDDGAPPPAGRAQPRAEPAPRLGRWPCLAGICRSRLLDGDLRVCDLLGDRSALHVDRLLHVDGLLGGEGHALRLSLRLDLELLRALGLGLRVRRGLGRDLSCWLVVVL